MTQFAPILRNLSWLFFSFLLALFIWMVATFQRDPIVQRTYPQVPIEMNLSEGFRFVVEPRRNAVVYLRAQGSIFERLTQDEIALYANLTGLSEGEHLVKLRAEILSDRAAAVADISPQQIHIQLEREITREHPIQIAVSGEPEPGYIVAKTSIEPAKVLIRGAASKVKEVKRVSVQLAIRGQRNDYQEEIPIEAWNESELRISDFELSPEQVTVDVEIQPRDDIRQITIRQPSLDFRSLPSGYYPSSIHFEPQSILVRGTPTQLANLPEFLTTQHVDLTGHTEDFEAVVSIDIPKGVFVVGNQRTIRVSIGITAQEGYRQFDELPIQITGLQEGWKATIIPDRVTIFLAGPLPILQNMSEDALQVQVDVSKLEPGLYSLPPTLSLPYSDLETESLSIVPALLEVELNSPEQD